MARHKTRQNAGRNIRLADQIQKDLAGIIQREIDVSRTGLITLTSVDLSPDYAHAKVYFTVLGAEAAAAAGALNEKAGSFHSLPFKLPHSRTVPTLRFIHAEGLERGLHLSMLTDQANRSDGREELPPPAEPDERD